MAGSGGIGGRRLVAAGLGIVAVGIVGAAIVFSGDDGSPGTSPTASPSASDVDVEVVAPDVDTSPSATAAPEPEPEPEPTSRVRYADNGLLLPGSPWGTTVGLLQFRGNPQHTYYGEGPVPENPEIAWRYPADQRMCAQSDGKQWCGSGWTGQPAIWERPDGITELVVGTYDRRIHFVDVATGEATRKPFPTGDIIKGSVTIDPDGFPLVYSGSRDNFFRIIALDQGDPVELWKLGANPKGIWNNDWDGNASIVGDLLFEGGEDSWFYIHKLNRGYDDDGNVTVDPELLFSMPGWTQELINKVGDRTMSIENSVVVTSDRVYFANGGGRVVGLDTTDVENGEAPIVFDWWAGDDIDASMVLDEEGMLYVSVELERFNSRSKEVGQLIKLDPSKPDDPYVWGVQVPGQGGPGGLWSTPALHGEHLYVATHVGDLIVVDRRTGEVVHREDLGFHEWSSPSVVDDTLIVGLCEAGGLRAYDLSANPAAPREIWEVSIPAGTCVESSPAVWKGGIYVGSRDGHIYAFKDS